MGDEPDLLERAQKVGHAPYTAAAACYFPAATRRALMLHEGLKVADKPLLLDASLEGKTIYMRWERPHGWLIGKITEKFTSATPRLFAKFNYRIKWFDGWENHKLNLDNYNSGPECAAR